MKFLAVLFLLISAGVTGWFARDFFSPDSIATENDKKRSVIYLVVAVVVGLLTVVHVLSNWE